MITFCELKTQPEHTAAELAMVIQIPIGMHSQDPAAKVFNERLFADPAPAVLPDPPGAQRRSRAPRGLDPAGIAARLLRLAQGLDRPITWAEIMGEFTSRVGVAPALNRLVVRGNLSTRCVYRAADHKKWRQWRLADRPWGPLPLGVVVVQELRDL